MILDKFIVDTDVTSLTFKRKISRVRLISINLQRLNKLLLKAPSKIRFVLTYYDGNNDVITSCQKDFSFFINTYITKQLKEINFEVDGIHFSNDIINKTTLELQVINAFNEKIKPIEIELDIV